MQSGKRRKRIKQQRKVELMTVTGSTLVVGNVVQHFGPLWTLIVQTHNGGAEPLNNCFQKVTIPTMTVFQFDQLSSS